MIQSLLESFFYLPPYPLVTEEKGVYQLPLVVLSYIVAGFASYTALSLAQQVLGAYRARDRQLLHIGGAFAMGAGIWSMHFIGMLSYKMKMAVDYDPWITMLSMLIAIAFSHRVLTLVTQPKLERIPLAVGAVLLGIGICAMHYTGMAAMRMDASLKYHPGLFFLSAVVAIVASGAALWLSFTLARPGKYRDFYHGLAAMVMGAAICGMHYVGMAAAVFLPFADCRYDPDQDFDALAFAIAFITSAILGIALGVSIYKRTQAETRMASSENRLRVMIDNAQDAVIGMDQGGHVTEWNKQAETVFGWTYNDVIGRDLANLIIPHGARDNHRAGMKRFLTDGVGPILNRRIEVQALNKKGDMFPVELTVSAHKFQDEYHFTAFVRDITDRRKSEMQILRYMTELEHSNQELEDFAHIASHDLKEPLRGLYTQANFLIEDYSDKLDEKGVHRLNRLIYLSKRMELLVSDLLYFSQIGQQELAAQETDLNPQIEEIKLMLETMLKEKNASIIVPNPLPLITCDKTRVAEVFRNLITNALKYNDKKEPVVEIGFLEEKESPKGAEKNVFYVRDNGIGIDPMFFDEIFRIFKRLDSGVDEKEAGTGVGLTFVKKIVERHGGRIWLESEPGKGTTFYFTLAAGKDAA